MNELKMIMISAEDYIEYESKLIFTLSRIENHCAAKNGRTFHDSTSFKCPGPHVLPIDNIKLKYFLFNFFFLNVFSNHSRVSFVCWAVCGRVRYTFYLSK